MSSSNHSFWVDRNVLVTGCTGLMGSWLCAALIRSGANVVGLIRDSVPRSRLVEDRIIDRINVVWGQVEDFHLLERCLNEYEVQTCFHLSAQTIVGTANANPLSTFDTNIKGTWNILEASRRAPKVREVIVASSDKAYGEHSQLPYTEETPLRGRHPYDVSKSCADLLAQAFFETYQLPVCITRFGNLFGGGDLNFNRLIPGTIRSVLRGEAPIIRSDGQSTRDYVYVEDAAQAYMLLAEKMSAQPSLHGEAFNFSYERPKKALEVVEAILSMCHKPDLMPVILNDSKNEILHQFLSSKKARHTLGWKPQFSFDSGMTDTIGWYSKMLQKGAEL